MARRYAENTTVPIEKSQSELMTVLRRYGASKTMNFSDMESGDHIVQCSLRGRLLRFSVHMPALETFKTHPTQGYVRTSDQMRAAWEQEERRRWRVLIMSVKAKFEEVESEGDFDTVFLNSIVLPDNQTVAEALLPRIRVAYETGMMPAIEESFQRALPSPTLSGSQHD